MEKKTKKTKKELSKKQRKCCSGGETDATGRIVISKLIKEKNELKHAIANAEKVLADLEKVEGFYMVLVKQ